MLKMTCKQAATCGENLKVRVTPEQSEKMQLAWFAAGKTWLGGQKNIIHYEDSYLKLDDYLSRFNRDDAWIDYEEIELIDEPQYDFASQQDVWLWLGQGNQIISSDLKDVAKFSNGDLVWHLSGERCKYKFEDYQDWKKHTQARLISVNGVVVPAPLESLEGLDTVWVIEFGNSDNENVGCYASHICCVQRKLLLGLCYANKEDAIKRAEAMSIFEVVE